jgi:cytochrome P450
VEEIIRFEGAIKSMLRYAIEDVEIKGKKIHKGELVLLVNSAANRDSSKFANAQKVDVGRRPNAHLGFGQGIHICLGAPLVRVEAHEAYLAISKRFPSMRLTADKVEYHASVRGRAMKALPIALK